MSVASSATPQSASQAPPASAVGISAGVAIGCFFILGVVLLVAGIVLYPASMGAPGTGRRLIIAGGSGCLAALLAVAVIGLPAIRKYLTPLVVLAFVAVAGVAIFTLGRDLAVIAYSKRSHASFFLEEISATSPSSVERTSYHAFYALRRRIAGADLTVDPGLPLDAWHLRYRSDLSNVTKKATDGNVPSQEQIAAWLTAGGLDLPLLQDNRLVLPPELAKPAKVPQGAKFRIVQIDDKTYALVPPSSSGGS